MIQFLLDTTVVVHHIRGKQRLQDRFSPGEVTINIITQAELLVGCYKSNQTELELKKITTLSRDLDLKIINLNTKIIDRFAQIRATLEKHGHRLEDFDLLIAATALEYNLTLLTHNAKHFSRIPKLRCQSI